MSRKKYLIVMAAGSGTRMGGELPKQFIEIEGKPILRRTIESFLEVYPDIRVITVLPEKYVRYWREYCLNNNFICPQMLVKGGITRFHSVRNALTKVPEGAIVAIHDGVRPFVTPSLISSMFERAENVPALIPVVPCVDSMRILQTVEDESGNRTLVTDPERFVDRSELYAVQTPQIFHSELIKAAYAEPYDVSFTDDASVVHKYGKSLSYHIGERLNIKITTQDDMMLANAILSLSFSF